jgi:hypothetical protein
METMMIAAISGSQIVSALIWLICIGLVFWLCNWLVSYIGLPEPFAKVAKVIIAVAAVIFLINVIMSLAGKPFINW